MNVKIEHDPDANAIYVQLSDKPYAYGVDLDPERRIDFAADRTPIGVEFLCVDQGVDLRDIPHAGEIATALKQHNIRVLV